MRHPTVVMMILLAAVQASAAFGQEPQAVPDAQQRPGETLTERLDRTDGVIKPPETDPEIQVSPPANVQSDMPVIKPPAPLQEQAPAGRN